MQLSNFDTLYKFLSGEVKIGDQSKQRYSEGYDMVVLFAKTSTSKG